VPLDLGEPDDARIAERLREILGDFFAERPWAMPLGAGRARGELKRRFLFFPPSGVS